MVEKIRNLYAKMFAVKDEQMPIATCAGVSDSLIGCPSKRKRIEPIFTPCQQ